MHTGLSGADIDDAKRELRIRLRSRRDIFVARLPAHMRFLMFRTPPTPLASLLARAEIVGAYVATGSEADPLRSLLQGPLERHAVALPYLAGRRAAMTFRRWRSDEPLVSGPFGIMQPSPDAPEVQPDVMIVPLLGFDRTLNRLGQGGGHYDRYFAKTSTPHRIGLAWDIQEVDAIPLASTDHPLNAVLTQNEWIS